MVFFLEVLDYAALKPFLEKLSILRCTFRRLRYPDRVINQALSTARRRLNNPATRDQPKPKYHLTLDHHQALEPLRPALRSIGVSTAFSSKNTLGRLLSKTGPVKPKESELPGVYRVECKQCPEGVYYGETGVTLGHRMSKHKNDIRRAKDSNALFVHMRDNPGHSFDHQGAKLIFTSNQKSKRQLVESSLIATNVSCNLKPGDFPVCRITAPVVLKSIKLDNLNSLVSPQPPATSTTPPDTSAYVTPEPTTIALPNPISATSSLTQALSSMVISSSSQPQTAPISSVPSLVLAPIATIPTPESPPLLQSQARAMPSPFYTHQALSPPLQLTDTPAARKSVSHAPLSQCHSPKAYTGATRKRRFVHEPLPDNFSPMIKRLRSSKSHHLFS